MSDYELHCLMCVWAKFRSLQGGPCRIDGAVRVNA